MPAESDHDRTDHVAAGHPDYIEGQRAAPVKLTRATSAVYRVDEKATAARAAELLVRNQTDQILTNDDQGGESACWLAWTCPECGAFVGGEAPENCPRCGCRLS